MQQSFSLSPPLSKIKIERTVYKIWFINLPVYLIKQTYLNELGSVQIQSLISVKKKIESGSGKIMQIMQILQILIRNTASWVQTNTDGMTLLICKTHGNNYSNMFSKTTEHLHSKSCIEQTYIYKNCMLFSQSSLTLYTVTKVIDFSAIYHEM